MKLNGVEKALMNNPVRAFVQANFEAPRLAELGGLTEGLRVLEVGCGWGIGTEIIFRQFGAAQVVACDLDPDMVRQARERLAAYGGDRLTLYVADAIALPEPDESFDAVFDFAILHHVPDWRAAVREIRRVLRPGGRFYFEEVTRQALNRWAYQAFLEHPQQDRFSGAEFAAELERQGFSIGNSFAEPFYGDFIIGVARRA